MGKIIIAGLLVLATCLRAAEPGAGARAVALFGEAETLARENRKPEALAKAEEAVAEVERAAAAGEKLEWQAMNGVRWTARLAREDFADYPRALGFCEKLAALADSDYWRVPARLERALTYRAMGDAAKAQAEYDAIAAGDERYRPAMLLPHAEMVFFDEGDAERGRKLLEEALMTESVNVRERYAALMRCASDAVTRGRRDEAMTWYALLERLPDPEGKERPRALSRAWYEMGRIEESRGRTAAAKALYRRALESEQGDPHTRVRARDALEAIEYFE